MVVRFLTGRVRQRMSAGPESFSHSRDRQCLSCRHCAGDGCGQKSGSKEMQAIQGRAVGGGVVAADYDLGFSGV